VVEMNRAKKTKKAKSFKQNGEKQIAALAVLSGVLSFHAGFCGYVVWQYILTSACIASAIALLFESGTIKFVRKDD